MASKDGGGPARKRSPTSFALPTQDIPLRHHFSKSLDQMIALMEKYMALIDSLHESSSSLPPSHSGLSQEQAYGSQVGIAV